MKIQTLSLSQLPKRLCVSAAGAWPDKLIMWKNTFIQYERHHLPAANIDSGQQSTNRKPFGKLFHVIEPD